MKRGLLIKSLDKIIEREFIRNDPLSEKSIIAHLSLSNIYADGGDIIASYTHYIIYNMAYEKYSANSVLREHIIENNEKFIERTLYLDIDIEKSQKYLREYIAKLDNKKMQNLANASGNICIVSGQSI